MFNSQDILAALTAGKSIEDIAQDAADAINNAKAEFDKRTAEIEAKKAAEEKRKKEELQKKRKKAALTEIANSLIAFMEEFYPENPVTQELVDTEIDAEILLDATDATLQILELSLAADELEQKIKSKDRSFSPIREVTGKIDISDISEDAIKKFLKENNLF